MIVPRSPSGLPNRATRPDVENAVLPPGQPVHLDQRLLHDEAEGDGDHGQIGAFDAQRRQREQAACDDGDEHAQRPGDPEIEPAARGRDGHGIGADRVETGMAEADLAAQADKQVEPDAGNDQQRDLADHESIVAVERERGGAGRGQHEPADQEVDEGGPRHAVRPCGPARGRAARWGGWRAQG